MHIYYTSIRNIFNIVNIILNIILLILLTHTYINICNYFSVLSPCPYCLKKHFII